MSRRSKKMKRRMKQRLASHARRLKRHEGISKLA